MLLRESADHVVACICGQASDAQTNLEKGEDTSAAGRSPEDGGASKSWHADPGEHPLLLAVTVRERRRSQAIPRDGDDAERLLRSAAARLNHRGRAKFPVEAAPRTCFSGGDHMIERATLGGLEFEYDTERGNIRMGGHPAIFIWTESTLAGLISGLQRMVGTERFRLALHGGGRDGVEDDWAYISQFPSFVEGFQALVHVAATFGWGRWELVSLDRAARRAVVRVRHHWEADIQRVLGAGWGSSYLGGKFSGIFQRHFEVAQCWAEQVAFASNGDEYDEFVITASDASLEDRLERMLATDDATRADLAVALERVRKEVEVRTETEKQLREKLGLIAQQEDAIRALATPIIEVWEGVLTLPLIGVVDGQRAADMMGRLLETIIQKKARYTILDLTGVEFIDTSTAEHLLRLVLAAEMLGAHSIITGIRPTIAETMVSIGIDLSRLTTLASLRDGLVHCIDRSRKARR